MLSSLVDHLQNLSPTLVYVVVAVLVFVEDAIFVGFVVPGETAAVLGGVIASRGHVHVVAIAALVVAAAVVGDQVGFTIGRAIGPRLLDVRLLRRHRAQLTRAQAYLSERGGVAVFSGRFLAFFRAVMPALAGLSGMPRARFLVWNAAGGLVWGVGYVLLGYLAGNSYARVEKLLGRGFAIAAVVLVLAAIVVWRLRRRRSAGPDTPS